MKGNLLIAQSGGPTAVINATLAGVVERALLSGTGKIYGGIYGIKGIMKGELVEIGTMLSSPGNLKQLAHTPSSALGTCRLKLKNDPEEFKLIIDTLKRFDIKYFVYIGGNDSMDTVLQLSRYCTANNIDINVVGAPKTIDNDLCAMDHTPGFGSAAKYIASSIAEVFCDISAFDIRALTIVEVMGRNAGWLAAAAALSSVCGGPAPQLIYLPEVVFSEDKFLQDVRAEMERSPYVLAVVSEGIKNAKGEYICEQANALGTDAFGHKALSGTAVYLSHVVKHSLGCKVRAIELSLLQRCAAHMASATDLAEAKALGSAALDAAISGATGVMPVIRRLSSDPYRIEYSIVDTAEVANLEKRVPLEWLNAKQNNVNEHMIEYLMPLIQGETSVDYKDGLPHFFPAFRHCNTN